MNRSESAKRQGVCIISLVTMTNVRNDFHLEGPWKPAQTDRSYVTDDRWSGRSCLAAVGQSLRRALTVPKKEFEKFTFPHYFVSKFIIIVFISNTSYVQHTFYRRFSPTLVKDNVVMP